MAYIDIIANVRTTLVGVANVKNVYDYMRTSADVARREELFLDTAGDRIHTWMITRRAAPSEAFTDMDIERTHELVLHGFYEVRDAEESEKTFQILVNTVMDSFNAARTVVEDTAHINNAAVLESFANEMFAGVLCHHAQIVLSVHEDVN